MEMVKERKEKPEWVDFREAKQVPIEDILRHYGVKYHKVGSSQLRGECPLPTHKKSKEQSFSANIAKNIWSCLSASCVEGRGGRKGGNSLQLVMEMEGCDVRQAGLKMKQWFGLIGEPPGKEGKRETRPETKTEPVAEKKKEGSEEEPNKPLGFQLQNINPEHEYLKQRGFDKAVCEWFGVGYFPGKGSMSGRVAIPIHNEKGELVAYAGRFVGDPPEGEPKYRLPAGLRKSLLLYNLHRALKSGSARVVVVEGYFDCMRLYQASVVSCVALMGSSLSQTQESLLTQHFKEVILMLDGDEAGRHAADETLKRLSRKVFVKVIDLPDGNQPDRLAVKEIQKLLSA